MIYVIRIDFYFKISVKNLRGMIFMQNNLRTGYVYSDELLKYRFNDNHPFNQMRLKLTTELLQMMKLLKDDQIIYPRIATEEELALIHKYDYIQAIKHASIYGIQ